MPFVFIVHHLSIVFQSMNDSEAAAVCMLIISLALLWTDIHIAIFCQIKSKEGSWQGNGREESQIHPKSHAHS